MKTVRLFGHLGEQFGSVHKFNIRTTAEAIRALSANFKGFSKYLIDSEQNNVGFRVLNGDTELETAEDIHLPASKEIHIVPVIMGSGATARIILGAALIAASVFIPGLSPLAAQVAFGIGASLAVGGVIELISPPPSIDDPRERPENTPSYLFNGPVNTTAQGHPVPLCYGRLIVGGAVISAGIATETVKGGFKRVRVETFAYVESWDLVTFTPVSTVPSNSTRQETFVIYRDGELAPNVSYTPISKSPPLVGGVDISPYDLWVKKYYYYTYIEVPV